METLAGKYKILKQLGQGGFGKVLLAQHLHLSAKYAIKLLNDEISRDEALINRFKREAEVLMSFVHPGSTQLRDFGVNEDGHYYMAMDFCEGRPMDEVIKEEGRMRPGRVLNLMVQVLDVLEAAHKMGIIHRDLKPANIMIQRGKQGEERVKVLDFGIAKLTQRINADQGQTLTAEGAMIGTPKYMAPEQAYGEKDLDHRADIYSLGIMMYHMLAGEVPFQGTTVIETIMKHINESPKSFREVIPGVLIPSEIEALVFKAIAKDKNSRFQKAGEFREACRQAASHLPEEEIETLEDSATLVGLALEPGIPPFSQSPTQDSNQRPTQIKKTSTPTQEGFTIVESQAPPQKERTRKEEIPAPPKETSTKKKWIPIIGGLSVVALLLVVALLFLMKKGKPSHSRGGSKNKAVKIEDSSPPEVALEFPSRKVLILDQEKIDLRGEARDPSGVAHLLINGKPISLVQFKNKVTFQHSFTLEKGRNCIAYQSSDKLENLSAPQYLYIYRFETFPETLKTLQYLCQNRRYGEAQKLTPLLIEKYSLPAEKVQLLRYQQALDRYQTEVVVELVSPSGRLYQATEEIPSVFPSVVSSKGEVKIRASRELYFYLFSPGKGTPVEKGRLSGTPWKKSWELKGALLALFSPRPLPSKILSEIESKARTERDPRTLEKWLNGRPYLQLKELWFRWALLGN